MIFNFLKKLFMFCVWSGFHFGAAVILVLLTKPMRSKGRYRVLSLSKPVFSADLKAISEANSEITFLNFPRLLLSEYVKKHVSNFEDLNDSSYYPIMEGTKEQEKVYRDIHRVFLYLHALLKFDAVLAGNYVYVSQQEFFRVTNENNIPVIILYKEGMGAYISMSKKISNELYSSKKFIATKILFYNEIIRDTLVEAGIPGISADKTSVVGIPRFDEYYKKPEKPKAGFMVLFAFDPAVKAQRFVHQPEKIQAFIQQGESFHVALINFCIQNPRFKLVIKTKGSKRARESMREILEKNQIEKLPENIRITATGSAQRLIKQAEFVAGSTSTTLLEALILNRAVICPDFSEILGDERIDFFFDYPQAVNYIHSEKDLEALFSGEDTVNIPDQATKEKLLEPLIYKLDGKASDRAAAEIIQTIQTSKNTNQV